jgi:hypothetical protein
MDGDMRGWVWEIGRHDRITRIVIAVTDPAWSSDPLDLPEDTRRALETDGRTELLKVLEHELPPRVIVCGVDGCVDVSAREVSSRT